MKTLFSTLLVLLSAVYAIGQNNWMYRGGGNGNDEAFDVSSDLAGNYYVTGYKTADAYFGGAYLESNGLSDIFLSKLDADGNFLWSVDAGGTLADRAYSVYTDDNGFSYITGYYSGTADFSGTTLVSNSGSQDLFLAKYDPGGALLWVISEGGTGAETGYDVEVDQLGNIVITGQFRGTITLGASTYVSGINPTTGVRDFDVFIAKYDASGNLLWSKHGFAPYDDRGIDLAVDNSNNIYLCGQFSDTISFDNTYTNNAMNAGFLMKMDENGTEDWFRTFAAGQSILYSVEHDGSNNVLVTGNFMGNLVVLGGATPLFYPTTYSNNIFLFKFDGGGNPVWNTIDGSENWVTARDLIIDGNDDVYVTGNFSCEFTQYSDSLGSGFFNSVGDRDVYISKYSSLGGRIWQRQFGGRGDDYCSGIIINNADRPMIAGSYGSNFWTTADPVGFDFSPTVHEAFARTTSCPLSADYYMGITTVGNKDVFMMDAYNGSVGHYNYYVDTSCSYTTYDPNINSGLDSIASCGSVNLYVDHLRDWPIGPAMTYQWSNGGTDSITNYNYTGYAAVTVSTEDACRSVTDSLYVEIYPQPSFPSMTDDHGFQSPIAAPYETMKLCLPDTVNIVFGSMAAGDSMWFSGPGITIPDTNTYDLDQPGGYLVHITNDYGCTDIAPVTVTTDTVEPVDTIAPYSIHPDSIELCVGQVFTYQILDSLDLTSTCLPLQSVIPLSPGPGVSTCGTVTVLAATTGYVYLDVILVTGWENACGVDTLQFPFRDTIYVTANPPPPVSATITGPSTFCPGDTVTLYAGGVGTLSWSGPVLQNFGDSVWVNVEGDFWLTSTATDSITGCSSYETIMHELDHHMATEITMNPADGIICPGDSVQLTSDPGINYYWVGPDGAFGGSNQVVYGHTPGWYHCVVTLPDGCVITSETVELYEYNTPFLIAFPGTDLCHSGTIDVQVWTNGLSTLNWLPPLSGSSPIQTIDTAGVYTCEVTQCGVTTTATITITDSGINTAITPSPDTIVCVGDTITLEATTGMVDYLWAPYGQTTQQIEVTLPGIYSVTTTDGTGCTASADIQVYNHTTSPAPVVSDTVVCLGDSAILTGPGGMSYDWYDALGNFISNSPSILIPVVNADTAVMVSYIDSNGCQALNATVNVNVSLLSGLPEIYGDTSYCVGETLALSTDSMPGVSYNWWHNGILIGSGTSIVNPAVTFADAGNYAIAYNDFTCYSDTNAVVVEVHDLPTMITPVVSGPHCEGESAVISTTSVEEVFWTSPQGIVSSASPLIFNPVGMIDSGTYYFYYENQYGCVSATDSISLVVYPAPASAAISGNFNLCLDDSLFLMADSSSSTAYSWTGPGGYTNNTYSDTIIPATPANEGSYTLITSNFYGCADTAEALVKVWVIPAVDLGNDTVICAGDVLVLDAGTGYDSYDWNTSETSSSIFGTGGIYWVSTTYGPGCMASDTILIITEDCAPTMPNTFSPNGDGINDVFAPVANGMVLLQVVIFDRWGKKMVEYSLGDVQWDGTNQVTGLDCPEGVYYYVAQIENEIGEVFEKAGFVQLQR